MTEGRSRGWLGVAGLALATAALSVIQPALLIFVPLALLFLALPPRRPLLLALAGFIGWLVFRTQPVDGLLWYAERGWALVLGAWFVALVALTPGWRFLYRGLAAVAGASLTAAVVLLVKRGGFSRLDAVVGERIRGSVDAVVTLWSGRTADAEAFQTMATRLADLQAAVYPAFLALASLAALGIAWWAYRRLADGETHPLGALREFRFRDELVWLLVAGVILMALPLGSMAAGAGVARLGQNLVVFMVGLYAVRGLAVLAVVGGVPGPLGLILAALLILVMSPFAIAAAFAVGLSDTWLDIRARRQAPSGSGS